MSEICFGKDFLQSFRRGGGALVAESESWKTLEKFFGDVYVKHVADEHIIVTHLSDMVKDPKAVFLLEIVGVPGVGKSKLIKQLIEGLRPEHFRFKSEVAKVKHTFEFVDVEKIEPPSKRVSKKTGKRLVWVTLNIDEFVSVGEGSNPLGDLYQSLKRGLDKGESLIVSGNIGVMEDIKARKAIEKIRGLIDLRNNVRVPHLRFPERPLYWTKEYGIFMSKSDVPLDPYFLTSGPQGFKDYSLNVIILAKKVLEKCISNIGVSKHCEGCVGPVFYRYIKKLEDLLNDDGFIRRFHDLLQFLWLKHRDIYLTARNLNIFWGYMMIKLWEAIEQNEKMTKIDGWLIYQALYSSKLASIYGVAEYPLTQTGIHRLRDKTFEHKFLNSKTSLNNPSYRFGKKLEYLFEETKESEYESKVFSGAFKEFLDEHSLASHLKKIVKRIISMRLDKSLLYSPEKDKEIYRDPWDLEKLLLATKIVGVLPMKVKIPLMFFDASVLDHFDIKATAFKEIQDPIYYLNHREKILRLQLKFGEAISTERREYFQKNAPTLHVDLMDYISLRNLISGIGEPVIDLLPSTRVKANAFLREIDGFDNLHVRPILMKCLNKNLERDDVSPILVRTLGANSKECEARIEEGKLIVELDGEEIFSYSRGGSS